MVLSHAGLAAEETIHHKLGLTQRSLCSVTNHKSYSKLSKDSANVEKLFLFLNASITFINCLTKDCLQ